MNDPVEWAKAVAELVKDYVGRSVRLLTAKMDEHEDRIKEIENLIKEIPAGPKGDPGPQGEPGANAYENAVSLGFQGSVHDWMYTFRGVQGEQGEPGLKGIPGESIKGDKGDPGESIKGDKGEDGKSLTVEEVLPVLLPTLSALVDITTKELFNKVPRPVDGKDGAPGIDGYSITIEDIRDIVESEQAKWALDFERRAQDVLRGMGDKIPIPKDGKDGFGFDDIDMVYDGERSFKFVFKQGERVKDFQFTLPIVIERGVYRPDTQYKTGDGVTYGGSYWIALVDTTQKPGEGKDWRLSVKKGRDGKDGERGERGLEGPKGKDK